MIQYERISRYGSHAFLIEWKKIIDPQLNRFIHSIKNKITRLPYVEDTIVAYQSCLVTLNHSVSTSLFSKEIDHIINSHHAPDSDINKKIRLPVCYDKSYGLDINLYEKDGISIDDLIHLHSDHTYLCYMMGFMPGFGFLGNVEDRIARPRKNTPRKKVVAGSVGIAAGQTGIYPTDSPGGWNIIGRCPIPLMDYSRESSFLFSAGDQVKFYPISKSEYLEMEKSDYSDLEQFYTA